MKQFFKDLFASDSRNNQSQQPIYSYQIPQSELHIRHFSEANIHRQIQKGAADAGPQYNIAGS